MRPTSFVVYLQIDELIPARGRAISGLDEFMARLEHLGIPCVWLTNRTRLQIDDARRKTGHNHPFIAEDGCGVYLPEDYFHLRPQAARGDKRKPLPTIRMGRFTCLPVAEPQPAAAQALESLAGEAGVSVVALRSLPPRELAQNMGLQPREADLAKQRDFDELFFFAGASAAQIAGFQTTAKENGAQVRPREAWWSFAMGASTSRCIRALSDLYDRALHSHAKSVGIGTARERDFLAHCDRGILLASPADMEKDSTPSRGSGAKVLAVPLENPDKWEEIAAYLTGSR